MNAPATAANQSPLEAALHEVHATLAELLLAASEQYAAVAARDRDWLERVTRQQEQLSVRLRRAERQRLAALNGVPLPQAIAALPRPDATRVEALRVTIAASVEELRKQQIRSSMLLERSLQLGKQTLDFLQRLLTPQTAYDARGYAAQRRSVLLDGHA
jgi:flagellar biosynthesis/type III secretory pathway chaperone